MTSKSNSNSDGNGNGNGSGSGSGKIKIKVDSSFRWNDGDVAHRCRSAPMVRAWIPAFAGMT